MKITGTGPIRSATDTKKTKGKGGSGSGFSSHLAEVSEPGESGAVSGGSPITAVDPIIAIDAAPDATDHKSATLVYRRGADILDRLEDIRVQILSGRLSRDKLLNLAQLLRSQRAKVDDPLLIEIIDEIELRAEVEIAKYTRD